MNTSTQRMVVVLGVFAALTVASLYLRENFQEKALHALPYGFKKFSLLEPLPDCGRWKEKMPTHRNVAGYHLYIEARKLWRSRRAWEFTLQENARILKDVSTAADMGDWGARALMAHFYLNGLGSLETNNVLESAPEKAIEIERLAVKAGQPWGFYDLGVAYDRGYGGVSPDEELAWAYYLRAAELGSPEAQMALASAYGKAKRLDDQEKMHQCAYRQGHGPAAYALATSAKVDGAHKEALVFHQEGVKFGSEECAVALRLLFKNGYWIAADKEAKAFLEPLGIFPDIGRSTRYQSIYDALVINPDLKLSRIDSVVPLPPAKLPSWNGVTDAVKLESNGPPTY